MEPDVGQPLTRREAREREARLDPLAGLLPTPIAHRLPAAQVALPTRRSVAASTAARSAKPVRPLRRDRTRPAARPARRRVSASSQLVSLVAMFFAAALVVGTSLPANAFIGDVTSVDSTAASTAGHPDSAAHPDITALQTVRVSADADPSVISRDSFSVVSYEQLMVQAYGKRAYSFTPTTGSIRWPFPYSVPISDGWGPRVAPCRSCSTFHQGVDFTPGTGSPIYAIADGIVEEHSGDSSFESFGNHVIIQHAIPGQNIESLFAHMITGSSTLSAGDHIKVGDFIGLVGETGSAVGAHLHFEIHIDKVPVDPFVWLLANVTNVPSAPSVVDVTTAIKVP